MSYWLARLHNHRSFLVLLVFYCVGAGYLVFRLPAFVAPNEQLHYEYIALLRRTGQLPDPAASSRMDERHQPPLYYTLAALASAVFPPPPLDTELSPNPFFGSTHEGNRNLAISVTPLTLPPLYASRLISMLFGGLGLIGLYAGTCHILSREVSLLVASLTACQPMYLFLSAAVGNDLAVTGLSGVMLGYTFYLSGKDRGAWSYIAWGLLLACAMLTKASAVFLITLWPIACLQKWRVPHRFRELVRCGLATLAGILPLYGGWLVYNLQRHLDAAGVADSLPIDRTLRIIFSPDSWSIILPYLTRLWRTFWLDWSQSESGYTFDWVYVIWLVILGAALAGWLRRRPELASYRTVALLLLVYIVPFGVMFIAVKTLMVKEAGFLTPEGRWVLPLVPGLAWLVAAGYSQWWSEHWRRRAVLAAVAAPIVSTTLLVVFFLPQIYPSGAQRLSDPSSIPMAAQPVAYTYDRQLELLAIQSEPLVIGQRTAVMLYWQALVDIQKDYSVAAVLLATGDDNWKQLEFQQSFPGNGLTPTQGWHAGDLYRDQVVFYPKGKLNGPTQAVIEVQVLAGKAVVPMSVDDQPMEMALAQKVVVRPAAPLVADQNSLLASPVDYDGRYKLVGVSATNAAEGLRLELWWRVQKASPTDYSVFVHLVDPQGQLIAQADGLPDNGRSPTSIWQPGDVIRDVHQFPVAAPPHSTLLIGLYDLTSLARLPAAQSGQTLRDAMYVFEIPQ
jgi:hypothetical protein